jgi:hypothetical protein
MKKSTFFFFLLFSAISFAQITSNEVKHFVGSGSSTAYLVVDFKDGTEDRSYVWGVHFDPAAPITGLEMLYLLSDEEPNFSFLHSGEFLEQIAFNAHDSYEMEYDNWSLWYAADGTSWTMGGWMGYTLQDGYWYGTSYGYGLNIPGPDAPVTPIPAYSSQWLSTADVNQWLGSGDSESLVVIDFGTTTNTVEDSYVFGIRYSGTISAQEALDIIQEAFPSFTYTVTNATLDGIAIAAKSISETPATLYLGTDLSNWTTAPDFDSITLENTTWLGIGFGARRPFIPQNPETLLNTNQLAKSRFLMYPNPCADVLTVQSEELIHNATIYTMTGVKVVETTATSIDVSALPKGVYIVRISTESGLGIQKFSKN